jgi:hypothetical protein
VKEIKKRREERDNHLRDTLNNGHLYHIPSELLSNCDEKGRKVKKSDSKWKCGGSRKGCMSLCDKIGLYPDIVSYQCSCEFEHRVCESCYIYYVEEARNKSEILRISKILNLERP